MKKKALTLSVNKSKKRNAVICKVITYFFFILVSVIIIFPLLFSVVSSMRTNAEIFASTAPLSWRTFIPERFSLKSYVTLFTDWKFHIPMFNTMLLAIVSIIIGGFINAISGFAFAVFDFKYKNVLFMFVYLSFMVPFEAIAIPVYSIVGDFHLLNTFAGLLMPTIAQGLVIYLFKQFFEELPVSLIESALLDGASWWTIFFRIALPLSKPVVISGCLVTFVNQWSAFLWPLVAARSRNLKVIQVAISEFMQQKATYWSEMFAAAVISFVIPMLIMLPFQKYYVSTIANTGGKE